MADLEAHGRLYVLADGVGGAAAGDVASRFTVDQILHAYFQQSADQDTATRLGLAVEEANAEVFDQNLCRSDQREMATTVVAAVIRGDELTVANVGDSRAYLVQGDAIEQITRDHSLMAEMIGDGIITAEQAETHPYRNVILRSVGANENVQADLFVRRLVPGDILILCSDGLTRLVSNEELAGVVRAHPPAEAARQLIALANQRGGEDNISVSLSYFSGQMLQAGQVLGGGRLPDKPRWDEI
jgi:protein phosphatase